MSLLDAVFDWFKGKSDTETPTRTAARRPMPRDWTNSLVVNSALTQGLFHNTYPGLKLAGAMAWMPIAVPIWFMGLPTPRSDDPRTQQALTEIVEQMSRVMTQIHYESHRDGTAWIMPKYSAREMRLVWTSLPDDTLQDIALDIETRARLAVYSDEMITLTYGRNLQVTVQRQVDYRPDRITTKYFGASQLPSAANLRGGIVRNPAGVTPIPFANNAGVNELRGHSDYERIVTDLKNYHDINLSWSEVLRTRPKLAINHAESASEWLTNNEVTSFADFDMINRDMIINVGDESAEFISLSAAVSSLYKDALGINFKKISEGSGIPELFWGGMNASNEAGAERNVDIAIKYVQEKQDQHIEPYHEALAASLRLKAQAEMFTPQPFTVSWNELDVVSPATRARIFASFANGIAALVNSAAVSDDQAHRLWMAFYPNETETDFDKFMTGLSSMAKHKSFAAAAYLDQLEAAGNAPTPTGAA